MCVWGVEPWSSEGQAWKTHPSLATCLHAAPGTLHTACQVVGRPLLGHPRDGELTPTLYNSDY